MRPCLKISFDETNEQISSWFTNRMLVALIETVKSREKVLIPLSLIELRTGVLSSYEGRKSEWILKYTVFLAVCIWVFRVFSV